MEPPPEEGKLPSLWPFLTRELEAEAEAETPPPEAEEQSAPRAPSETVVRIALLLPLSGPNARLGTAMSNAAQLAMFDFADKRFEILFHDTRGTPEGAVNAIGQAIGDGAALVLGPLLSSSARAVAPAARAANVPVIAFSSDRTVAGDGIYTMGFFPDAEVERVVTYALSRGLRRFAALVPNNQYGETVVQALRRTLRSGGARLTRVETYDPRARDHTAVVRRLASYGGRRQALLDQVAALEGRTDPISRRAMDRLKKRQTIGEVSFNALMLADGGKRLQAIAALLPFFDIDPAKVQILGTGQWDEPGTGAEPALVGGWYAAPPPEARADFVKQYKSVYGGEPPRLATLAYDATALAAVLSRAEPGPDFSRQAITTASGFWGRDGIFRFLAEGLAQRGLAVLQAGPTGSKVISKAPTTFQSLTN